MSCKEAPIIEQKTKEEKGSKEKFEGRLARNNI